MCDYFKLIKELLTEIDLKIKPESAEKKFSIQNKNKIIQIKYQLILRHNSIDILKCLVKEITDVNNKQDKIEIQSVLYPIMPNLNIYKDPITNMFIAICNAIYNFKESIIIRSSIFKIAILKILKEENYISSYTITKNFFFNK